MSNLKARINKLLDKLPAKVPPMEFITYIIGKQPEPLPGKNKFIEGKSYEHIYYVANENQKQILQEL